MLVRAPSRQLLAQPKSISPSFRGTLAGLLRWRAAGIPSRPSVEGVVQQLSCDIDGVAVRRPNRRRDDASPSVAPRDPSLRKSENFLERISGPRRNYVS